MCPTFTYCAVGGKPFEEIESTCPDQIKKIYIDVEKGVDLPLLVHVASELDIAENRSQIVFLMKHLYDCFIQRDAELIEINPLVVTKENEIVAAETKVIIDDSALFRQADLKAEEDLS